MPESLGAKYPIRQSFITLLVILGDIMYNFLLKRNKEI